MILGKQSTAGLLLALLVSTTLPAHAGAGLSLFGNKKKEDLSSARKLTPGQNALVDKAIGREKEVIKTVRERAPLVETYIQNMKPDPVLGQIPESDQHFLGRVEFNKVIGNDSYEVNKATSQGNGSGGKLGFFKQSVSYLGSLGGSLQLTFHEAGFVQMLLMDSNGFDRQHYAFGFVRNDFLGSVPTAVFDVTPISGKRSVGHGGRKRRRAHGANRRVSRLRLHHQPRARPRRLHHKSRFVIGFEEIRHLVEAERLQIDHDVELFAARASLIEAPGESDKA